MAGMTAETGQANIGTLLRKYNPEIRYIIRKTERIWKKIKRKKMSVVFNEFCINEGLLPNYTIHKLHDAAAKQNKTITEFRRELVLEQITSTKNEIKHLNEEFEKTRDQLKEKIRPEEITKVEDCLHQIISKEDQQHRQNILKKLCKLYKGNIILPNLKDNYVNLSKLNLTNDQKEFLNLGPNCHLKTRFDPVNKKTEIEMLFQSISKLQTEGKITVDPNLRDLLKAEGLKNRSTKCNSILTKELKLAAKELKNNPEITIKKADKTNMYVVLDKKDYEERIQNILNDSSKFKRISRDPTEKLRRRINAIIDANNAQVGSEKLNKIIGEYRPGYIYGTVKLHKKDFPLRPIVSQIPTPTYSISKKLNNIISKYLPSKYSVHSTDEFISIIHSLQPKGMTLSSLDADSLFTNVPIDETIDIVIQAAYKHDTLPAPKINPSILKKLLIACTRQTPFKDDHGRIYVQTDGICMGSCLAPTLSEFYMSHLENKILESDLKPDLYLRYVDDILILTKHTSEVIALKTAFENNSVLTFKYELSVNDKIAFLDVLIESSDDTFITSPYKKPTSKNSPILNFKSECPERYKIGVLNNLIHRAKLTSSDSNIFYKALKDIKQTLINNGYPNNFVDKHINTTLENLKNNNKNNQQNEEEKNITIFYCNQINSNYKQDETCMRRMLKQNISPVEENSKIRVIIYYNKFKTANLVLCNNPSKNQNKVAQTNVVYEFTCPFGNSNSCNNSTYIGETKTSLSRRLTCHKTSDDSSINIHLKTHGVEYDHIRKILVENTEIIFKTNDLRRLLIVEALNIKTKKPTINKINFKRSDNVLLVFNN